MGHAAEPDLEAPDVQGARALDHLRDRDLASAKEREVGVLLRLEREALEGGPEGPHDVEGVLERRERVVTFPPKPKQPWPSRTT